jgi:adenine-specific DNA methylase
MAASAKALVLSVAVASDASASSGAPAFRRRPRLARSENDGGNNASADTHRTDAPNADRTLRPAGAHHERPDGISGRLRRAKARAEIWRSWRRACAESVDHPRAKELFDQKKLPAFHDPFAGGGALPLEAQRLGARQPGRLRRLRTHLAAAIYSGRCKARFEKDR